MSHLHTLTTEELHAEIQHRKGAEVQAMRDQIAEHRKSIATLESKIAAFAGEKPTKTAKVRGAKIDPAEADKAVLAVLDASKESLPASKIAHDVGFDGAALKTSLTRLEADGKIVRTGNARATVYSFAA
jgi:predicted Rossmann fold nucleotide-binding protein DprA/Smf involved in DNA uptake